MKKIVKYELTQEEKDILLKCAHEVAVDCDCNCNGCPFELGNDNCILEKLQEMVEESE
ncbi:MAG: hypothetical protein IJ301_03710 [Clostridia bacterium]|nr:hypothetical protein [Clostridia bacterium]